MSLKLTNSFFIYGCVNDDADTMKLYKMLNACDFCNLFVFCRSYIRSDVSFKYLAAILDAILDFSKCTRVTGSHTTDSKRGYLPEHFDTKTYYAYSKVRLCIYTSLAGCRTNSYERCHTTDAPLSHERNSISNVNNI